MSNPVNKPYTGFNWIVESICLIGLLMVFEQTAIQYNSMPNTIPIHFDTSGNVNGYGNKLTIWIMSFTALIVYAALTTAERFPHKFNYLIEITEENADHQYLNAIWMIRILKTFIIILFIYITNVTIDNALTGENSMSSWMLPFVMISIIGTIIYFLFRSFQLK